MCIRDRANEAKWRDIFVMDPGEVPGRLPEDIVKTSPPLSMQEMSPDVELYDAPQQVVIPAPARRHVEPIYCILSTPKLIYTRLLPLLTTSLADAPLVYAVSYTHLRAHETPEHLVCRLLLEKKKKTSNHTVHKLAYIYK
eukprot:TRINITY_DN58801_c0_g1_i1.p1 TRINITY_DN58801_c0_g1~~TRINITY_DN58801_c0_g1_i1.p1  ORF type:complete len:140 (-),score=29.09 TRINITY_DN58801_c0_g1_i1:38-457(-)